MGVDTKKKYPKVEFAKKYWARYQVISAIYFTLQLTYDIIY